MTVIFFETNPAICVIRRTSEDTLTLQKICEATLTCIGEPIIAYLSGLKLHGDGRSGEPNRRHCRFTKIIKSSTVSQNLPTDVPTQPLYPIKVYMKYTE